MFFENQIAFWLVLSLFLVVLELSNPGLFFFLALSGAALASALSAYLEHPFISQIIIFFLSFLLNFLILHFLVKKYQYAQSLSDKHQTNIDALIGQKGVVTKTVGLHLNGQVKIRGESWSAESVNGNKIEVQQEVIIVRLQGNKVFVQAVATID
jgi:membrane protein implicated in regulation of membrane protease activity